MESLWEQTSGHTGFGHLEQDAKTDVLIIGGGIAGVLCAYLLHQAGVLYLLLEAETIGRRDQPKTPPPKSPPSTA